MTRESGVTYEAVRRACCAILAQGEQPTRPSVQALLAQEDFLGHKGSNSIVQGFVTQFRIEMAGILSQPERTVPGVPDDYVALQDKMLVEMVAVTRRIVTAEFEARDAELQARQQEMNAAVEEARQAAANADALRLRAEGERDTLEATANEWKAKSQALADENRALAATVTARDEALSLQAQELAHTRSRLDEARRAVEEQKAALAAAEARHRQDLDRLAKAADQERARLLQQIDDLKQTAKREAKALNDSIARLKTSVDAAKAELATARTTLATSTARCEALAASTIRLDGELQAQTAARQTIEREKITLQVRLDTAERLRQDASIRLATLEPELAELKTQLKYALAAAQAAARQPEPDCTKATGASAQEPGPAEGSAVPAPRVGHD